MTGNPGKTLMSKDKILVIGGNLAGLSAARNLGAHRDVTLVDPSPWCEWLPNIHELISGAKTPESLRLPLEPVLHRLGHRFVQGRVERLDPDQGSATLADGTRLRFDLCIVAVGGVNNDAGVSGVDAHAWPFKSVRDCDAIHQHLNGLVEDGERHSIAIVGGGLEGVEALGEILRGFSRYRSMLDIHLVEGGDRLMADSPERVDRSIRASCRHFSVKIHTRSRVAAVESDQLVLNDGRRIPSELTLWTGGCAPHPLLHAAGLTDSPGTWAPVRGTLMSEAKENVFVVGDAADTGEPLGKQAYHAMAMGELAAANVEALLDGKRLRRFEPAPKPQLVTFGNLDCFLIFERMVVAGTVLGQLKEAIYQVNMARLNPPRRLSPALGFYQRLYNGFWHSLWPNVTNLSSLLKLPQLRVFMADSPEEERREQA